MIVSRRCFIQASLSAAGGLAIAAFAPKFADATMVEGQPWSPETGEPPNEVNALVVIDPDNSITLRVAKSEMGQGVLTSMALIIAEELECSFDEVKGARLGELLQMPTTCARRSFISTTQPVRSGWPGKRN